MTTLTVATADDLRPRETTLEFVSGMPGLEAYRHFTLIGVDDEPVCWMECDDEPAIALPVVDAFAVLPEYAFQLSTADVRLLELDVASDALILAVLSARRGTAQITANLLAPVVVNRVNGRAKQVILDGTSYSLRHPVQTLLR